MKDYQKRPSLLYFIIIIILNQCDLSSLSLTTRETECPYSYNKLYNLQTDENVMLLIYCLRCGRSNDGENTDLSVACQKPC